MRLIEIYSVVTEIINSWEEPVFNDYPFPNSGTTAWVNVGKYEELCEKIAIFDLLSNRITEAVSLSRKRTVNGRSIIGYDDREYVVRILGEVYTMLCGMRTLSEKLLIPNDNYGFDIKLPNNITLEDMSKCLNDLNKIFNQCPILKTKEQEIRFGGVDSGSIWLIFRIIGCGTVISLLFPQSLKR